MPKIEFSLKDLCLLLGRDLPPDYIAELLENSKCEVERVEGGHIEIEVTSDRPDMFSVEGIARYLKGILGIERGIPRYKVSKGGRKLYVDPNVSSIRPYVAGYIVRGVKLNEEQLAHLMQFQEKLHQTLCRDRKKASIGVYDLSTISGDIYYRAYPLSQIRFRPLGHSEAMNGYEILKFTEKGREYKHLVGEIAPLLMDSKRNVLSMPPIINSEDTRVTEHTKDFFIDSTGFDWEFVSSVATLVAMNIAERGGVIETLEVIYSDGTRIPATEPSVMQLDPQYTNAILGLDLQPEDIADLLRSMRYNVENGETLKVFIPRFRLDILHPIDLVEDIAIAYGYNNFIPKLPYMETRGAELPIRKLENFLRELMVGMGFQEVMNYMMSSPEVQIFKMNLDKVELNKVIEVENPVSLEYRALRIWLLPSLLGFLSHNLGVPYPQKIFEIGYIVERDSKSETLSRQELRLGAVITAYSISFEDIQAVLYELLCPLEVKPKLNELIHPSFIEGRAAEILVNNVKLGFVGEVHPSVLLNFGLKNPAAALEISLDALWKITEKLN